MASINLSFREWPFSCSNQRSGNQLKTPSFSSNEMDELNKNVSSYSDYCHLSSWGRCGLFACTNETCLSIYSNDEKGNLTPMFMFSPFEVVTISKINKQQQKTSYITAIGWSDGHLEPSIPNSILAASSAKGHLVVYDFDTKEKIANIKFDDTIISILWSSFKQNRFYAGSKNGHFYICEINDQKSIEIVKQFDFTSRSPTTFSDTIYKSIDFITQDDVNGHTIGIASKDQQFGFITNADDLDQIDIQIFQNLNFKGEEKSTYDKINFFQFYPNSQDFIGIATDSSSFILSISKSTLVPFIQSPHLKFISLIEKENDKVIVGDENEISIWQLVDQFWVRLFNMSVGLREILTFSTHNNKILLTTASSWLTEIEFKRNKLFITKRIRLIDGSIVDYDLGDGSIAFLTSNNSIMLTENTPESVINPTFSDDKISRDEKSSDESSQQSLSSNDDDNDSLLNNNLRDLNIKSDLFDSDTSSSNNNIDYTIHGNSNTLVYAFNINNDSFDLKHVKWISPKKIVVWCKYSLYLIDLQTRSITEPLMKKFCKKTVRITQVFFSKSRKIMGIVIDHIKAYLLNTESNLEIIKSFDFSDKFVNENDYLLGSFSPKEDMAVFSLSNYLYFTNLNEKGSETLKVKSMFEFQVSFLSWENKGIFIGTEKGGAGLITNDKFELIFEKLQISKKYVNLLFNSIHSDKLKLDAVKSILPCSNQRYIIVDSSHKGIMVSKEVKIIADNIKTIKLTSNDNFLVKLQNYNRLIAFNSFNELTTYLPPCFFLSQERKNNFLESIKDIKNKSFNINDSKLIESISDQLFLSNNSLRNSVQLLNEFISTHDPFNSVSSKTFLKLGNLEEARQLFLKSNPSDKDYFNNITLAAVYDTNSDSAHLIVDNFLSHHLIDEAVDVLLMTKEKFLAADVLSKNGRNEDAYRILMMNNQKNECVNAEKIILNVADSLISKKENVLFGLKLLSSFGYLQEMINHLSLIVV